MFLIVEDNDLAAKAILKTLEKQGFEAVRARNGLEALQRLQIHPDIDLVIADIMMPQMDGLTLLRRLRESTEYATLPVIMCTAVSDVKRVKEAAVLGCRHYLVKPLQPAELLQRIAEATGKPASG